MDFQFSADEERYRSEVRGWLDASVPAHRAAIGEASDGDARFAAQRTWHRALYEAGCVGATWPVEYGGRGRTAVENAILQEEFVRAGAPATLNALGIGLCGPALLHHGRPDQKERFLRKILTGEEIWCQGYSEPGAGSDLASLRTRADLDGERFIVNGQKTWTSLAHRADWCFALVVTDPNASRKHDGIGFLLIDMRTPGIEVRPIEMITGDAEFNEVFFKDVEVPRDHLVGEATQGWRIANTVLGYERGANTLSQYARYRKDIECLRELLVQTRGVHRQVLRARLAQLAIDVEVLRLNSLRQLTALARGDSPGSEASIQKLFWSELDQRFHRLAVDLLGASGALWRGSPRVIDEGRWAWGELNSLRFTIARGTSEIQRNIISERVLGLPR